MRLQRLFTVGLLALSFTATSAFANSADKAKKQTEIRGKVTTTLQAEAQGRSREGFASHTN